MLICRKKTVLLLLAGVVCMLMTGCAKLPTLNLSRGGTPTESVTAFMDAVVQESKDDLSESVYNYDWRSEDALRGRTVSASDLAIIDCVKQSRSYSILKETVTDSHHADIHLRYTCFNVREFQNKLTEIVTEDIKERKYNGERFSDFSDTVPIIEAHKAELLEEPTAFYTTEEYHVAMVSSKGRWRIVMTDEFYNALTGYTK